MNYINTESIACFVGVDFFLSKKSQKNGWTNSRVNGETATTVEQGLLPSQIISVEFRV